MCWHWHAREAADLAAKGQAQQQTRGAGRGAVCVCVRSALCQTAGRLPAVLRMAGGAACCGHNAQWLLASLP
jgi:hypothetical protein